MTHLHKCLRINFPLQCKTIKSSIDFLFIFGPHENRLLFNVKLPQFFFCRHHDTITVISNNKNFHLLLIHFSFYWLLFLYFTVKIKLIRFGFDSFTFNGDIITIQLPNQLQWKISHFLPQFGYSNIKKKIFLCPLLFLFFWLLFRQPRSNEMDAKFEEAN